jgi:hypothetical protein
MAVFTAAATSPWGGVSLISHFNAVAIEISSLGHGTVGVALNEVGATMGV